MQIQGLVLAMGLSALLAACGGGDGSAASGTDSTRVSAAAAAPEPTPAVTASAPVVPAMPPPGAARAGRSYSVFIQVPATGNTVAFTVFEPATLEGGQTYPLILHSHGFQGARYKSRPVPFGPLKVDFANPLGSDFTDIGVFIDKGYGVVSIDQRAHGDSNGSNRVMDPDFEGKNLLAVLDWLEANLPWLKYGPSADGTDPHNLVLGSIGTSYGGMFQFVIHNTDPKKRLDAMVPMWAPYDLNYSLSQGNVPKTLWNVALFGIGNLTGLKTLTGFDPFIFNGFITSFAQNELTPDLKDLLAYHSNRYFCDGQPVATNGGPGTRPERAPVPGGKVNVLLVQGIRDTLFNLNEGHSNYSCFKKQGGDVRLLTTQTGHNTLQITPDLGQIVYQPGDLLNEKCGTVDPAAGALAFFEEHLKGIAGAASAVPKQICLSIAGTDAALVDDLTVGRAGTQFPVRNTTVVAGVPEIPAAVHLFTAPAGGEVVGGIARLEVDLRANGLTRGLPVLGGAPILFAGLGIQRNALLPVYELLNNQVTPLKGLGRHDVDLSGVAARLQPGEKLVLLLYGGKDQYLLTGSTSLNLPKATVMPVQVSGNIWVPKLGLPATTR